MSKANPSFFRRLAFPPGCSFFSITVTLCPCLASKAEAVSPPYPAPITMMFFIGDPLLFFFLEDA